MASIGVDFKLKNIEINNKRVKIQIWDTAGQERYKTITTSYYRNANAITIVYDITDNDSFEHVKLWLDEIHQYAKENILLLLVGNKIDLEHKRKVTLKQGQDLAKQYGLIFIETSAKSTINIHELFNEATKAYIEKSDSFQRKNKNEPTEEKRITTLVNKKKNSVMMNIEGGEKDEGCCK